MTDPVVTQADDAVAEEIASAANIVSHDGYYEIDIDTIRPILARHRLEGEAAGMERTARIAEGKRYGDIAHDNETQED